MAKLISNLSSIARQAPLAASAALLQTGADVFDISQQFVPVDKGDLKASGGVVPISSQEVRVGYGAEHGPYQEFGTVNMPAQPFLTPAFRESEEIFKVRLLEELEKTLSRAGV